MVITCWGSRGSIPVSGPAYNKYGGDTTCLEIRTGSGHLIIVDAGTGIRRLGNHLLSDDTDLYHMIFTHAHWDHIMGFPFFKPVFLSNIRIKMYRCPFPSRYLEKMLSKVMAPPNFPVKYDSIKAEIQYPETCGNVITIGSVAITAIALSHPNTGAGYLFEENGKRFVFLTDNELRYTHPGGLGFEDYCRFCQDADLLIHDGEYTPEEYADTRTWGHSTYVDALDLGLQANVKNLGLFHLNQDRKDPEMDGIVADCDKRLAAVGSNMNCFGVGYDFQMTL